MNVRAVVTRPGPTPSVDQQGRAVDRQTVCVECSRCGQSVASPVGSDDTRIVARLLVLLRDSCPRGERNFYNRTEPS